MSVKKSPPEKSPLLDLLQHLCTYIIAAFLHFCLAGVLAVGDRPAARQYRRQSRHGEEDGRRCHRHEGKPVRDDRLLVGTRPVLLRRHGTLDRHRVDEPRLCRLCRLTGSNNYDALANALDTIHGDYSLQQVCKTLFKRCLFLRLAMRQPTMRTTKRVTRRGAAPSRTLTSVVT